MKKTLVYTIASLLIMLSLTACKPGSKVVTNSPSPTFPATDNPIITTPKIEVEEVVPEENDGRVDNNKAIVENGKTNGNSSPTTNEKTPRKDTFESTVRP